MPKQTLHFGIFLFLLTAMVFAGGRKANESHEVSDPAGFTESIDIQNKKPGKWNFYLEATDKGGNTTRAGAHNIYIDPLSDIPSIQIINPTPNMHVQGNLNIVGTCTDDDGVDYVELIITRGSDGKGEVLDEHRADGKEFWSFFIDTTDSDLWMDGIYTVTAWGVDINGLSGISESIPAKNRKMQQVSWNLDRKKPEITVTSHILGDLVSGKVNVKGTIWDGNGIDTLTYSLDNGDHYLPVAVKIDTRRNICNFDLPLDTRTLADGPTVIMFKAKDKMRSEGILSFLLYINNTGPTVQILYPEPDKKVNGIFSVAGLARHEIGLRSLKWKLGKDSGELPLTVGNPWWAKEFDIRGQNVKALDLEIEAVDLSGNKTTAKRRILVDQDAGLPRVSLIQPVAGSIAPETGMALVGYATDNEGIMSLLYSIDGQAPVEIPCAGYFQYLITDISAGVHNLEVWAKDITGVTGPKVSVRGISAQGTNAAPQPRIIQAHLGSGKTAVVKNYHSGMDISAIAGASLDLSVYTGSGLQSLSYQLGSRDPVVIPIRGGKAGTIIQSIPIPKDIENGLVKLEVNAWDLNGNDALLEEYFVVTDLFGERIGDDSFAWVQPDNSPGSGRILLSASEPLIGVFSGGPVSQVAISGADASSLAFSVDNYGRVSLRGTMDGSYGPLQLSLTGEDGRKYSTGNFSFVVGGSSPDLNFVEEMDGKWVKGQIPLKFRVSNAARARSLEFSADLGDNWRPLLQRSELSQLNPATIVERTLDISGIDDGSVNIIIRIVDDSNTEILRSFLVHKDTVAPEPRLIVPVSGARVNGTIRLGIAVAEAGRLASVVYRNPGNDDPGNSRSPITKTVYTYNSGEDLPLTFLDMMLDTTEMPLSANMSIVFTDMAGNSTALSNWPFIVDEKMDLPVVQISLPFEDEVVTSDFVISGICYDDDEISRIVWRIDDGPEKVLETKNGYSIDIPLSSITDNEHSVTIRAEDIFGIRGEPVTRKFKVSLEEPTAIVALPSLGDIVGGTITIAGVAMDKNGIKRVQVSLDNGNSFNDAEGTTRWTYAFNSKIMRDGPQVMFIRVWDNYDVNSLSSSMLIIDNTPPELVVNTPRDGMSTTGPLYITGQAVDNMKLDSVIVYISSLEGVPVPDDLAERQLKLDTVLLEELDLSSLPDGNYNVELWAIDVAENVSRVSRNIALFKDNQRNFIDNLYPLNGQYIQGNFNLYGFVGGIDTATEVTLIINGIAAKTEPVTEANYYCFAIYPDDLKQGANTIVVRSDFSGKEKVDSAERILHYRRNGPWVTVDTMNMGDFAYNRPWLLGRAGYELSEYDLEILADKKANAQERKDALEKQVAIIELSFDNGRSFFTADKAREKGYDWRYRLETQDLAEGLHYLIARATMVNGEVAVTRLLIQVDKTPPVIRLISPESGGHYNESITYSALASDDVELQSLSYHLRKGDKNAYEIPGFIKGLYLEGTLPPFIRMAWNQAPTVFAGGATFFDVGMGLSFFGDNVKLQVSYGQMTQNQYESLGGVEPVRYGGHVLGIKILANVYTLPFAAFGGPDWEWLSASFALGANFSLFNLAEQANPKFENTWYTQSKKRTWMTAMIAQIEFPKVTVPTARKYLKTFSMFTEGQLWFVPTDVDASANKIKTVIPHVVVGLRMYIF